jgi:hypothetical protein
MEGKTTVRHQVVFVMDVTGSMMNYIVGTKEQVQNFIGSLQKSTREEVKKQFLDIDSSQINYIFEVAIVAYRDFKDDVKHFETLDFTSDLDQWGP